MKTKISPAQLRKKLVNLRFRMKQSGYEFNDKERICILPENESRRTLKRESTLKMLFNYGIQFRLLK